MLRNQARILVQIFLKPKAFCSTTVRPPKQGQSLFQKLSEEFSDVGPLLLTAKRNDVKNVHFNEWRSRIYLLKSYGFDDTQCFEMISKYSPLLQIPFNNFSDAIERWYNADIGWENFQMVLLSNPELLEVNVEDIEERLPYLRSLFKNEKNLVKLLINSPNVMCDDWSSVLLKFDYLSKEYRFVAPDIVEAHALSKSIDFIKFRLDLLEKCGIFKKEILPIHKINKYDKTKHKNPHLKSILCTDVNDFVEVAKISREEYDAYKEIFTSEDVMEDEEENFNESYKNCINFKSKK